MFMEVHVNKMTRYNWKYGSKYEDAYNATQTQEVNNVCFRSEQNFQTNYHLSDIFVGILYTLNNITKNVANFDRYSLLNLCLNFLAKIKGSTHLSIMCKTIAEI